MKAKYLLPMAVVAAASIMMTSCQLDPYTITNHELYTRNFIKKFGLIDAQQDWNLAKSEDITLNINGKAKNVKVYASIEDKNYLVAQLNDVSGKFNVPLDIPESCSMLSVGVDGRMYKVAPGGQLIVDAVQSRDGSESAPVVNNGDVEDYLTITGPQATSFLQDITEMHYNRNKKVIVTDFLFVGTGEPIIVNPIYFNSSQTHTLGIYYFTSTEEEGYNTLVKVPLYTDKEKDDETAHLLVEQSTTEETYTLSWAGATTGTYNLGWTAGASESYTLGWQNGSFVGNYYLNIDWANHTVTKTDYTPLESWLKEAIEGYLSANSSTISSSNTLLTDANFISAIVKAANTELGGSHEVVGLENWSIGTYIQFTLNTAGAPSNTNSAPTTVFNYVKNYLEENNLGSYSEIDATNADFSAGLKSVLGVSDFIWATNGSNVTISFTSSAGPANGNTNTAPSDVFEYVRNAMSTAGATSYDDMTSAAFTTGLENAIKAVNGPEYSLVSWEPNGQSAVINWKSAGSPYLTNGSDALQNAITAYVYAAWDGVETDYSKFGSKSGFVEGLQDVLHNNSTDYSADNYKLCWIVNEQYPETANIQLRNYDGTYKAATADTYLGGKRVNKDGTTNDETLQKGNYITSYNIFHQGNIKSKGISVTIEEGRRYGFYVDCQTTLYSEVKGNIEYDERTHNVDLDENDKDVQEDHIYGCVYAKPIPGLGRDMIYLAFEDWMTEDGTDGDLNDLVIALSNVDLERDLIREPSKKVDVLSWLIAAEDLGDADDFDFNDVVFKMETLTTTTPQEGDAPDEVTLQKEVKIKALAAGGTLPVWLHYYNSNTDVDYIVGPNGVVRTSDVDEVTADDYEWHKWFGNMSHESMVNTLAGPTVNETSEYTLISLTDNTTTSTDANGNMLGNAVLEDDFKVAGYSVTRVDGKKTTFRGFYLTVGAYNAETSIDDVNGDDTRQIGAPRVGEAPQMFLIPDIGKSTDGHWQWPRERHHIMEAYGTFQNWVKGAADNKWYSNPVPSEVIRIVE